MSTAPLKFGILSTAGIAHVIVPAIKALPQAECYAVASRDVNKARSFAEKYDIPHACTYSKLLQLPIDAVYIPLPTSMCTNWATLFAKAGKHVLVDKPLNTVHDVTNMLKSCEKSGVVFLDGTHFVHSARTKEIQRRVFAGDIGSVRRLDASFTVPISNVLDNIRSDSSLEPQTFLGDLGWYCARAAVTFLGVERTSNILSTKCTARFHPRKSSCIQSGSGIMEFEHKDETVTFCFSFDSACSLGQKVSVIGNMGILEMTDFVIPLRESAQFQSIRPLEEFTTDTEYTYERSVKEIVGEEEFQMMFPRTDRIVVQEPGNLSHAELLIQEFCRLIIEDDKAMVTKRARESLVTQGILDAIMSEIEGMEP